MQVELPVKETIDIRQQANADISVPPGSRRRFRTFTVLALLLSVAFFKPLLDLITCAVQNSLYSHILLIPFVSGYLIWLKRDVFPASFRPSRLLAAAPIATGVLV